MTAPFARSVLDSLQRLAARSPLAVRLAVAIRNQCRCVIKYHLAESPDARDTGERWLVERVASYGDRFVDVGANVGDWLGMVRESAVGRPFTALAFEPSRSAFEALRDGFGGDANIALFDVALGASAGSLSFFEEADAGRGSSLVADFVRAAGTTRSVTVTTLDAALRDAGWDRVDLLKVDAEGYDLQVMRGASASIASQSIGVLQFEYNRAWQLAGDTLRAAYTLLEGSGYRVFVLKRDGLYTLDYLRYEEYFEYTNFVGIAPQALAHFEDRLRGVI
ncbi:MAG TPA: FkbM family methyltransferase [Candidatus Acidoferrales bacterium]|nr:FkbM family methyltransferase [Candidatus Acidoferrales bacterium]